MANAELFEIHNYVKDGIEFQIAVYPDNWARVFRRKDGKLTKLKDVMGWDKVAAFCELHAYIANLHNKTFPPKP